MPSLGSLYLLFTPTACRLEPLTTLAKALEGGVDVVQWRAKGRVDRETLRTSQALCHAHRVPFLINDDVMLAVRVGAAGAHVGQDDMAADAARKLLFGRLLGVSTHDERQIAAAVLAGSDYVGFGPCHPTATKGYEHGVGLAAIEAAVAQCAALAAPMFAIGGIEPANLPELLRAGVRRVAVSRWVLDHRDPRAAAAELRAMLP